MLIILSGVETIHKKFLARKILAALNTFTVDGYSVDFNIEPFKVTDTSGKIVYCMAHGEQPATNELLVDLDNDGVIDPEGNATFDKIIDLNNKLLLDGGRDNHFYAVFIDLLYDFGITNVLDFSDTENAPALRHPHNYASVLENYKNRLGTTHVITGIFSKGFIDRIKTDIGAENVIALNIIRNPSASTLLHKKSSDFYADPGKELTVEQDLEKLQQSIINSVMLARSPDVITIKFEDIITAGKFTVNGIDISLPVGYEKYNDYLTNWEKENVVPQNLVSAEEVEAMNQHLTTWGTNTFTAEKIDAFNGLTGSSFTTSDITRLNVPQNIFNELGYTPLSSDEISE
jgi:hypothetical protein